MQYVSIQDPTGVCEQKHPPEKSSHWNIGFQSTKSGAGEQFLLLDCRAMACTKGVCLFTDISMNDRQRARYSKVRRTFSPPTAASRALGVTHRTL